MEAIRVQQVIAEDGKITITDLPYNKGETVEVILLSQPTDAKPKPRLTVQKLRQSGLIGMWKDRQDIQDSSTYARQLRKQAQKRLISQPSTLRLRRGIGIQAGCGQLRQREGGR